MPGGRRQSPFHNFSLEAYSEFALSSPRWSRNSVVDGHQYNDHAYITVRLVLLVSHPSYAIIPTELLICDEAQGRTVSSLVGNASYVFSFIGERGPRYVRYSYLGSCRYSRRTLVTRLACLSCWRRINSYPHRCGDHCSAVQPLCGKARSSSLTHSHDCSASTVRGKNVVTPYLVNRSFNLSNHNNLSMLGLNCKNCSVPVEHHR